MTTITLPRAVVEQALEALESCDAAHPSDGARQWYDDKLVETAITTLRTALAQPQHPPVTKGLPRKLPEDNDHGDWDRIDALEASLREHMAEIHRLRTALAQPAPAPTVEFGHGIGADRFKVVRGSYWWHILIGDSPIKRGKFHTQAGAEEMVALLLREFRNGAFVQHITALRAALKEQA